MMRKRALLYRFLQDLGGLQTRCSTTIQFKTLSTSSPKWLNLKDTQSSKPESKTLSRVTVILQAHLAAPVVLTAMIPRAAVARVRLAQIRV